MRSARCQCFRAKSCVAAASVSAFLRTDCTGRSLRQGSEIEIPVFGLAYAAFRGMNGTVQKTDADLIAALHVPANRTAASHFGKTDAVVIISIVAGLVVVGCLLGFVLL